MKRFIFILVLAGIMTSGIQVGAFADEEKQEQKQEKTPTLKLSGFGYFMFGQIVDGLMINGIPDPATSTSTLELNHYWQENADVDLYLTSKTTDWLTTKAGLSVITSLPLECGSMNRNSFYTSYAFSVPMAEGIFNWNFENSPLFIKSLMVEAGFFPYTFNPDVKNLGNYMYRSSAYPLSIQTKLDYPWANLMGLRTELGFLDNKLKVGAIFNSEIVYLPWYDWSLGFTVSYTPNKVIDIGLAACFDRLINVGHSALGPDSVFNKMKTMKYASRITIDPKPIFGTPAFFGAEDCKVYSEVAVIGSKDDSLVDYVSRYSWNGIPVRRMPLLLGFNVPAFKLLDVLSLELEWFNSPYANDWLAQMDNNKWIPANPSPYAMDIYKNKDNFKWSVYLKKKIVSNFEVRAIAANDHTIYKTFDAQGQKCTEQTLKRPGDWHWYLELRFNF